MIMRDPTIPGAYLKGPPGGFWANLRWLFSRPERVILRPLTRTPEQIAQLRAQVERIREASGRP
jgi:hypothetical protein